MARRQSPTAKLLRVSRRQLAGLGVVGVLGIVGGLSAALDLGDRLARAVRAIKPPSEAP